MDLNVIVPLIIAIIPILAGSVAFFHKKLDSKVESMSNELVKHKIQLERKLDSTQVKEIISDKLAGICVILDEIKNDIKEIKYNSRHSEQQSRVN